MVHIKINTYLTDPTEILQFIVGEIHVDSVGRRERKVVKVDLASVKS